MTSLLAEPPPAEVVARQAAFKISIIDRSVIWKIHQIINFSPAKGLEKIHQSINLLS